TIEKLLQNGHSFEVIICAGEGQNMKVSSTFTYFKRFVLLILNARSTYFKAAFSANWAKK
ncbi:15224_t:CDS:1, partial [Dentiscutata heterogama]